MHLPPERANTTFYKSTDDWFHMDQSLNNTNFDCIQGFISAYDVNDGDSTLSIYENSHKYQHLLSKYYNKSYPNEFKNSKHQDLYMLNSDDVFFYNNMCQRINLKMTAGSLVL